jgi:hypothetical protein
MNIWRFVYALALLLAGGCAPGKPAAPEPEGSAAPEPSAAGSDAEDATQAKGPASRYTSLKACKLVDSKPGEDWSVSRCPGQGAYTLVLNYGDARDDLALRRTGHKDAELGLPDLSGGGFNAIGDAVEWRGVETVRGFKPATLIVRNAAVQDPERPENPTSLLVVVDLAKGCAVAQVGPGPGQNERARAVADGPARPCLKGAG